MKRKRKTSLPRVTILAFNRRELTEFVLAVESLRNVAEEIRLETTMLRDELAAAKRRKRSAARPIGGTENDAT